MSTICKNSGDGFPILPTPPCERSVLNRSDYEVCNFVCEKIEVDLPRMRLAGGEHAAGNTGDCVTQ